MSSLQHRIRPWPDNLLSPINIDAPFVWRATKDDVLLAFIDPHQPWDAGIKQLPDEFWLREVLRLDLSNPDEIATFCTEYGCPNLDDVAALSSLHGQLKRLRAISTVQDFERHREVIVTRGLEIEVRARMATLQARDAYPRESRHTPHALSVAESRCVLGQFRDLARIVLAFIRNTSIPQDEMDVSAWRADQFATGDPEEDSVTWAALRISAGLHMMQPRLIALDTSLACRSHHPDEQQGPLFDALCVQLFNAVVENPHVSVCDWCHQEFIHQRGRSKSGRHRAVTDASKKHYCSAECSMASAKKSYRDRQRASEKGGERQ